MPTMTSALSLRLARPLAAAAFFAAVGFAGVTPVRADEAIAPPAGEMVLVPVKTIETLEQRVLFLEETVTALTESWQHINTHRVCAADDAGVETCVSKAQLDALLAHAAQAALSAPAPQTTAQAAEVEDSANPVVVAATAKPDETPAEQQTEQAAKPWDSADPAVVAATAKPSDEAPAEQQSVQAVEPSDGADPAVVAATASTRSEPTAAEPSAAPAPVVTETSSADAEPETTGSVQPASTGAAVLSFPHVEIYEEPAHD